MRCSPPFRRSATVLAFLLGLAAPLVAQGAHGGMTGRMNRAQMEKMMSGWGQSSRDAAMMMMQKYGRPMEATASMMTWGRTGPWKRTVVYREEVDHQFPGPHKDVWQQFIDYRVPPDQFGDLAMYDGSVIVERTKGEISARCDKEAANFLALNLANEIVTKKRSVDDARKKYAEEIMKMKAGQTTAYTSGLMFTPPMGGTADPDHPPM